ncbi:MAG: hypothetical protein QY307_10665 [Acidimicrobiia bacterium]|nr:MAG: hypothetical protein QY307_10665 [Acidimicrobiia bacterium]
MKKERSMNEAALSLFVRLLDADVVDRCPEPGCSWCHPAVPAAA